MKFAKIVFWVAGIWGVLVITPMFFSEKRCRETGSCGCADAP